MRNCVACFFSVHLPECKIYILTKMYLEFVPEVPHKNEPSLVIALNCFWCCWKSSRFLKKKTPLCWHMISLDHGVLRHIQSWKLKLLFVFPLFSNNKRCVVTCLTRKMHWDWNMNCEEQCITNFNFQNIQGCTTTRNKYRTFKMTIAVL